MTVNHGVPGSSPGWGALLVPRLQEIAAFFFVVTLIPDRSFVPQLALGASIRRHAAHAVSLI